MEAAEAVVATNASQKRGASAEAVLLGIAFAAAFGASATTVAVTLGIATMPTSARLTRAAVLAERSKECVLAARTLGATPPA